MLYKIAHEKPAAPRHFNSEIPLSLQKICLKALQKDKNLRQENAQVLADELEKIWQRPVARPDKRQLHGDKKQRSKYMARKLAPFLIVALAASVAGLAAALFFYNQLARPQKPTIDLKIIAPRELAQEKQLQVSSQTETLQVRGKITGANIVRLLLDDGEIDWQPHKSSFQAEFYLRYGANRRHLWILTNAGYWIERKWKINRRQPPGDTSKSFPKVLPGNSTDPVQEKQVRAAIGQLIADHCQRFKRPTLGLLIKVIQVSIAFGVPLYNRGDHQGCYRFYFDTARNLVSRFLGQNCSALCRQALIDLQRGVAQSRRMNNPTHQAWILRFAFDQCIDHYKVNSIYLQQLKQRGLEYWQRGYFSMACKSFSDAANTLADLQFTQAPLKKELFLFAAPTAALFLRHQFHKAAASLGTILKYIPDWPQKQIDHRYLYAMHEDKYQLALSQLQKMADKRPRDATLQFLLGYQFYVCGQIAPAKKQFIKTLTIAADHFSAAMFLRQISSK